MRNFFFVSVFFIIFSLYVPNLWGGSNSSGGKGGGQSVLPMAETAKNQNATDSYKMQEMKVTATHLKGSVSAFMQEEKASPEIVDALSAEQMSRAGDTYLSESLRRLPGVTLVNDKNVHVRGLAGRYNTVLFNGAQLPSTDPTRKVIELDLFPSDVLEGAVVQKSYSPDVPASFAGGAIMMQPRAYPQEFFAKISGDVGYRTDTTLEDGLTYEGGDTDYLGYDDGTRDLPDSVPSNIKEEDREAIGEDFPLIYNVKEETTFIDQEYSFSFGDKYRPGTNTFGYVAALRYNQDWQTTDRDWKAFDLAGNTLNNFDQKWTDRNIDTSAFLNLGAEFGNNHKFSSTTMLLRRTTDTARVNTGHYSDWATDVRFTEQRWVERSLFNQQLGGNHSFPALFDMDLGWQYTFGMGERESPDRRIVRYEQTSDGLFYPDRADNNPRSYEEMDNYSHDFSSDLSFPLPTGILQKTTFKTGIKLLNKSRDSEVRRFRFTSGEDLTLEDRHSNSLEDLLSDETIGPGGFQIQETTSPSDKYEAEQTLFAGYGMVDSRINNYFGITGGIRYEDSEQDVDSFEPFSQTPVESTVNTNDIFPAISGTWFVGGSENTKVRAAVSETINRPDFRELSRASYTDPITRLQVQGFPGLEETSIQNADLRFEHFFSDSENVAVSVFYKHFDQPIQRLQQNNADQTSTFRNAEEADNYGVELEALKYLGFIHDRLSDFYLGGNLALIESELTLGEELEEESTLDITKGDRALQGQSDWVFNLNAGYENIERGTVANLVFNISGERISQLGTQGRKDIKKQPVPRLSFIYSQDLFQSWKFKFQAENLLNPDIEYKQGSKVTRTHDEGRAFSMGLTYTFR